MAIEAIAAVAAKEVVAKIAAEEVTKQLAEKIATQSIETKSLEQMQNLDQLNRMESFRLGERADSDEKLKLREKNAEDELRDKINDDEVRPECYDVRDGLDKGEKSDYYFQTINESLKGDVHPITGVPFEEKTVIDIEGNQVTGVFPEFDSKFDVQLPEEKLQETDRVQFSDCNEQLKEAIKVDSELAECFTPEQLEQIKNGDTPDGYTWHHNEELGKMQLVDSDIHARTGHTGGKAVWGGGIENR